MITAFLIAYILGGAFMVRWLSPPISKVDLPGSVVIGCAIAWPLFALAWVAHWLNGEGV